MKFTTWCGIVSIGMALLLCLILWVDHRLDNSNKRIDDLEKSVLFLMMADLKAAEARVIAEMEDLGRKAELLLSLLPDDKPEEPHDEKDQVRSNTP